jgi:hypothetical protein
LPVVRYISFCPTPVKIIHKNEQTQTADNKINLVYCFSIK